MDDKAAASPPKICSLQEVVAEMKSVARGEQKAPTDAGTASYNSMDAYRRAQQEQWLVDNKEAIEAYNQEISRRGVAIPPLWERKSTKGDK